MWNPSKSNLSIENMILENASSLSSSDPEILSLQSTFASFESSRTYVDVLTFFATKFITSESEHSLKFYLRSCLQLLITYSLCTSDQEWILQKGIVNFKEHAQTLESLIPVPRISISSHFSLHNCLQHANLLEANANLSLLRVSVIRMLFNLNDTIEPNLLYKSFDFENKEHADNAMDLYERLKIRSQPHSLTSTAFSLAINPSPFNNTSLMPPPPYSDQDKATKKGAKDDWWG